MDTTQFIVVQIDGTKSVTALQTAKSLHKQLKDIGLKPKSFYIEEIDLRQIYLFFGEPVKSSQAAALLQRWLRNNWFSVDSDAVTVLPSEQPLHIPVQGNFSWLNEDFNSIVNASEIAFQSAVSMFMQDLRNNGSTFEDFSHAMTQTRYLEQTAIESNAFDDSLSTGPEVSDMTSNVMSDEIDEVRLNQNGADSIHSIDIQEQNIASSQEDASIWFVATKEPDEVTFAPFVTAEADCFVKDDLPEPHSAATISIPVIDIPLTYCSNIENRHQTTVTTASLDVTVVTEGFDCETTESDLSGSESPFGMAPMHCHGAYLAGNSTGHSSIANDCEQFHEPPDGGMTKDGNINDVTEYVTAEIPLSALIPEESLKDSLLSLSSELLQASEPVDISDEYVDSLVDLVSESSLPQQSKEPESICQDNLLEPIQDLLFAPLERPATRLPPMSETVSGRRRSAKQISSRDGPDMPKRSKDENYNSKSELYEQLMLPFGSNTS